ncbi:uncharacterized protein LOC109717671 [Ananas comosus]|uniref:Uncharacterized protein LOC109717671 n=1 Tax=Ananas comosus TaxID=4615 RepID=A0A6P5FS54_ANACO|nr:uncharacterized protein LOC109717671 [Ananas comosus]
MGGEEEKRKEVDAAAVKRIVKQLNFGGSEEERAEAASEVGRLARADGRTKRFLAELGVVPTLVRMIFDSRDLRSRISAAEALIELGRGTFKNKVLMVEAGLLTKLPQLMPNKDFSRSQELFLLLSSISSLAKTDFALNTSHILPLVFETLNANDATENTKLACLATLYNLSTKLDNFKSIVSNDTIHALLTLSLDRRTSEGALSILSNLVVSPAAKRRIADHSAVPKAFVVVMSWDDKPKCRELAVYLMMVVAQNGCRVYREKLVEHGAVEVLLEIALLGSDIARRRAMKILQWIKNEGEVRMRVHSGPRVERVSLFDGCSGDREEEQCRRAIGEMVKESLKRNMASILRKATAIEGFSNVKGLCTSSSSKSLPY